MDEVGVLIRPVLTFEQFIHEWLKNGVEGKQTPLTVANYRQSKKPAALNCAVKCLGCALALFSGMSRGEICGLQWKDIEWENDEVNVRRTRQYRKGHEIGGITARAFDCPRKIVDRRSMGPMPLARECDLSGYTHPRVARIIAQGLRTSPH